MTKSEVTAQNRTGNGFIGDNSSEARVLDAAFKEIGKSDGNGALLRVGCWAAGLNRCRQCQRVSWQEAFPTGLHGTVGNEAQRYQLGRYQ